MAKYRVYGTIDFDYTFESSNDRIAVKLEEEKFIKEELQSICGSIACEELDPFALKKLTIQEL